MFQLLKKIFARGEPHGAAFLPEGTRVYAVGDIHGRLDLFESMIARIEADDAAAPPAETHVVLLGDLVDRGADSAGVIDRARRWQGERRVRILTGNHEEMFLRSMEEVEVLRHFLRHGGRETVLSYGVAREEFAAATLEEAQDIMRRVVPPADIEFIRGFDDMLRMGDYLFVHAGIEPGVPLEEQTSRNMRWIREPFLSCEDPHGVVVVHGHTIRDQPEDQGNRIGIDTGAFRSGRLTALVLEGGSRRYLTVEDDRVAPTELAA